MWKGGSEYICKGHQGDDQGHRGHGASSLTSGLYTDIAKTSYVQYNTAHYHHKSTFFWQPCTIHVHYRLAVCQVHMCTCTCTCRWGSHESQLLDMSSYMYMWPMPSQNVYVTMPRSKLRSNKVKLRSNTCVPVCTLDEAPMNLNCWI